VIGAGAGRAHGGARHASIEQPQVACRSGTSDHLGTYGGMEPRLIIAYTLIVLMLAAGALLTAQAMRRRRRHREVMRGGHRLGD
jgi:hypothetical protein